MPGKHTTVFPLRRYGFIGGAATLLVVLVSWVAVRAVGPTEPDTRIPLMVQPTVPLAAGAGPSLIPSALASSSPTPSASPSSSPSRSASPSPSPSPSRTTAAPKPTTKPAPRKTTPPAPANAFTGTYATGGSWERGFIGAVTVTNKSGPARTWTVRISYPDNAGVRLGNVWNATLDRQGNTFVLTGGPLAPGAATTLGFEASKQVRDRIQPTSCTVDGTPCRLS
ncbi:cellulose binding domain-containing protein [Actinoplanes sp. NPDC049599]|uniref:cellulose binding domain-containing protein n=1 Tax=Actinoplanes sp. NPDC049599 TaxID=3363903 RepID=UPI0037AEE6E3